MTYNQFWNGDCLELMSKIPDGSIDMVLCDLPYGTTACKWDMIIPFEPLWKQYWRIAKPSAAIVLTASQPFTTKLISSQIENFKHQWIWWKKTSANVALAKHQPLKTFEDIVVFGEKGKRVNYKPQMIFGKKRMKGGKVNAGISSGGLKPVYYESDQYYPTSILEFKSERGFHPTQKPVALFEYLIKTYTNEGETVLDNCAGSGTTAIAAINTNRRYICIEKDPCYYYGALARIAGHVKP